MMLERVLVTGANGHLGRRLLTRLLREIRARSVRAVVRSERAEATLKPLVELGPLEIQLLDPTQADALVQASRGCTHFVHLVGILKEAAGTTYEMAHEKTTEAVAKAAAKAGAQRVVYLSVLGADTGSRNPCLASKARAERILLAGGVHTVVLRVPMVLGKGELAARALRAQATGGIVPLLGGGTSREQPIDAEDVVEAILRALVAPKLDDTVLELAGPESLTRAELVRRAADLLGGSPRIVTFPLPVARSLALLAEWVLVSPPVTRAMLGVLEQDDCIDPQPACADLGLQLTPLDETLRRSLLDAPTS